MLAACSWRAAQEEAQWLDLLHQDADLMERVRRNGQAAFAATMDLEFNARGVVDALLQVEGEVGVRESSRERVWVRVGVWVEREGHGQGR